MKPKKSFSPLLQPRISRLIVRLYILLENAIQSRRKTMSLKKYGSLSLLLLGFLFALFLSACGTQAQQAPQIQQLPSGLASLSLLVSSSNLSQQISTSCPAPGTGRAAVLPHLTLGSHRNVVYTYSTFGKNSNPPSSTLKRYDVVTKTKTVIYSVQQKYISAVQISADG